MTTKLPTKHQLSIATSLCYKQYFGCAVASSGIAYNGLQLGAVCDGLWVGNCAKVLLGVWF